MSDDMAYEITVRGANIRRKTLADAQALEKILLDAGLPEVTIRPFRVRKVEDDF